MYTTNAYYPSPIDGNYYQAYLYLNNGQIAPLHFSSSLNGIELVYYSDSNWGMPPTANRAPVYIKNGCSNLVYYQPQLYGQAQLLYCISGVHQSGLTLMLHSNFQQFVPVVINDSQSFQITTSPPFIQRALEQNPNRIPATNSANLPPEILQGLLAVQSGALTDISIKTNQHGFHLTAEDQAGNRYVLEKHSNNGIHHTSETVIDTLGDKVKRLAQVKQLRANGMTQIQIANHLGVSQKTISNDLKELSLS